MAGGSVARLVLFVLVAVPASPTLREAANSAAILIGTAVRPGLLSEPAYSATLAREFNMVEPEDAMKWWAIRQHEGTFDFNQGDDVVHFAQARGMKVRGHCLVWDHTTWTGSLTRSSVWRNSRGCSTKHIAAVRKHCAGRVFALGCGQRSAG